MPGSVPSPCRKRQLRPTISSAAYPVIARKAWLANTRGLSGWRGSLSTIGMRVSSMAAKKTSSPGWRRPPGVPARTVGRRRGCGRRGNDPSGGAASLMPRAVSRFDPDVAPTAKLDVSERLLRRVTIRRSGSTLERTDEIARDPAAVEAARLRAHRGRRRRNRLPWRPDTRRDDRAAPRSRRWASGSSRRNPPRCSRRREATSRTRCPSTRRRSGRPARALHRRRHRAAGSTPVDGSSRGRATLRRSRRWPSRRTRCGASAGTGSRRGGRG